MGANQSMEQELGMDKHGGGNPTSPSSQALSRLVNGVERAESAHEDSPCLGLEDKHGVKDEQGVKGDNGGEDNDVEEDNGDKDEDDDIEDDNGSEEGRSLNVGPDFSIVQSQSRRYSPSNGPSSNEGVKGGRDVEDASSTAQGYNKGGPCLPAQGITEQAASKEAQPRAKKTAEGNSSCTQCLSSSFSLPEKVSDFSQNNMDSSPSPPSLHLIRIKRSHHSAFTRIPKPDIIKALQGRPAIDFDGGLKRPLTMDAAAEWAQKRGRKEDSTSGEALPPAKKPKVDIKIDTPDAEVNDEEEQEGNWDYDSEPDRFVQDETPPSSDDSSAGDTQVSATPVAAARDGPTKTLKKKVKGSSTKTKEEKKKQHAMVDRYNTLARSSKYKALHRAVLSTVKSPSEKAAIAQAALVNWEDMMAEGVSKDNDPETMKSHLAKAKRPDFKTKSKKPIQNIEHSYQNTNNTSLTSSSEATGVEAERRRDDSIISDIDETQCVQQKTVAEGHKFEYALYIANNTQSLARSDIRENATQLPESFTDREQANAKLLELTRYENFEGDIDAVTRRNIFEYTPLKLLKAELTLTTGEERVFWVDRHLVDLQKLTKRQQRSKKWSAKRPALPHFIVECEFMTRSISETPQQPSSDDNVDGDITMSDEVVGVETGDLELERLPLATFTDRTLANDHAGMLFLRHSAIREEIRGPLDDFWWVNNPVAVHREAEKKIGKRDGLYAAELYTMDMNTRLGFDWIRVAVYAVDDVTGPLNI
ncbi:hypothetical protein F4781DRAFT_440372 [Annulohypoxylon bovei var. microspora]|nr:hypothetical protein F4781DRAFT_440372 [Annulohypoxylon bovei var. microspora]